MKNTFSNPVTEKICQFIREIDISVEAAIIDEDTFLPGIYIRDGAILVDEDKLLYPGDLLHEAAHLATTVPEERDESHAEVGESGGDEMMAIAGSRGGLSSWWLQGLVEDNHREFFRGPVFRSTDAAMAGHDG